MDFHMKYFCCCLKVVLVMNVHFSVHWHLYEVACWRGAPVRGLILQLPFPITGHIISAQTYLVLKDRYCIILSHTCYSCMKI
jgi:hypothetical protein